MEWERGEIEVRQEKEREGGGRREGRSERERGGRREGRIEREMRGKERLER